MKIEIWAPVVKKCIHLEQNAKETPKQKNMGVV